MPDLSISISNDPLGGADVRSPSNAFEGLTLKEACQKFDYTQIAKMGIDEVSHLLSELQSRVANSYKQDPEAFATNCDESFGRRMFLQICLYASDLEIRKCANTAYDSFCNFKNPAEEILQPGAAK